MFSLSPEQLTSVADHQERAYVTRVLAHVGEFFPHVTERLTPQRLQEVVGAAIERARGHGLLSEQDIVRFVDLVFVFGPGFDERLAWARKLLQAPGYGDPSSRIVLLWHEALQQLEANPPPEPAARSAPDAAR